MIKQQRLDKLEEKEKFLSTIEDILIEDKQVLDLVANTEIEKIESDEDTKYEDVEHSDEDEQVLTPLCHDRNESKIRIHEHDGGKDLSSKFGNENRNQTY